MSGPPRALALARSAVADSLADLAAEQPAGLVLVACSGGADSLALAVAAAYAGPRVGLRAGAVVVDHGMQDGSAEVAQSAAEQCRALGLDPVLVRVAEVAVGPGAGGPEGAARTARYAELAAAAEATGACAVLLGHTADDQAETVLLGLARGSGARSLAGMRTVVGTLRRPLLGLRRSDTEQICLAAGLPWWTDPTNLGSGPTAPLRSQVRNRVLPVLTEVLGSSVVEALARTAEQLAEDDEALGTLAEDLFDEASERSAEADRWSSATVVVGVEALLTGVPAVRRRALRLAALTAGCPAGALSRAHVLALDRLLTDWHGQGPLHLPGAVGARRDCGRLVLEHLDN